MSGDKPFSNINFFWPYIPKPNGSVVIANVIPIEVIVTYEPKLKCLVHTKSDGEYFGLWTEEAFSKYFTKET